MLKLFLLGLVVAAATASHDSAWAVFKATHNKVYGDYEEEFRRTVWEQNLQAIEKHNELYAKGLSSFYMGENEFSDMTEEEVNRVMNGMNVEVDQLEPETNPKRFSSVLPVTVDWRTKGYVTPIKNQGQCGSCWAFSTTGTLEGQHFKKTKQLVSLSESNLVDCSKAYGNHGCKGGLPSEAYDYIIANKGIDTEASYPYVAKTLKCKFKRSTVGATEVSYKSIPRGSESDLQQAVATVGPISVAIDASKVSFHTYAGGIYNEPKCSSSALDHGVLVVGYGTENGQDYWLVKNSWGTSWGVKGYIKMSRNRNNQCGIATLATYPLV